MAVKISLWQFGIWGHFCPRLAIKWHYVATMVNWVRTESVTSALTLPLQLHWQRKMASNHQKARNNVIIVRYKTKDFRNKNTSAPNYANYSPETNKNGPPDMRDWTSETPLTWIPLKLWCTKPFCNGASPELSWDIHLGQHTVLLYAIIHIRLSPSTLGSIKSHQ